MNVIGNYDDGKRDDRSKYHGQPPGFIYPSGIKDSRGSKDNTDCHNDSDPAALRCRRFV
jgi:hypothetical protein